MELNQLIAQLLESKIIENQELAVNLLRSPEVSQEEKQKYLDKFVHDYSTGNVNFFSEEQKNIFKVWVELYAATIKDQVKNRVKRIQ